MENKKIHIGIIPDGNRRYAKKYNISLKESYEKGINNILKIIEYIKNNRLNEIDMLTIYALSKENLKREKIQLKTLFYLFKRKIKEYSHVQEDNINVYFYGDIPEDLKKDVDIIHSKNSETSKLKINILLGYSGRDEIINAIKKCKNPDSLNEENFYSYLWIKKDLDLIIRTGGYQRLSNFLIYQAAYAELYFTEKLWNEFEITDFENALKWFYSQKRNFGR